MVDFPANVSTGRVHGSVLQWLTDSVDPAARPDVEPFSTATVKFTPSVKYVLHPLSGALIVPIPKPITLALNGDVDVTLIATDDPDINPTGFTYKVEITLIGATIDPFDISVPSGSDRTLASLVTVAESGGVYTTQGANGASAYDLAVLNGYVGTLSQWLARWVTTDGSIVNVVSITQSAYVALNPKSPTTLYVIT